MPLDGLALAGTLAAAGARPMAKGTNRESRMVRVPMPSAPAVQEKIQEMVRRIAARFEPDRIVLFGSHARGDAGPDSDVDLLVIKAVAGSIR